MLNGKKCGARARQLLLFIGIVSLVCLIVFRKPIAVQYHRLAMRSWHPQREWDAWSEHQEALVNLGYFENRDFPLRHRVLTNSSDLMRLVDRAPFQDAQWTVTSHTNRISVTAYHGDMELWEKTVGAFDRRKGINEKTQGHENAERRGLR